MKGITDEDIRLASRLVNLDEGIGKVLSTTTGCTTGCTILFQTFRIDQHTSFPASIVEELIEPTRSPAQRCMVTCCASVLWQVIELPEVIESDTLTLMDGKWRIVRVKDFEAGQEYNYFLDVGPESFNDPKVKSVLDGARTVFVNAVMGTLRRPVPRLVLGSV